MVTFDKIGSGESLESVGFDRQNKRDEAGNVDAYVKNLPRHEERCAICYQYRRIPASCEPKRPECLSEPFLANVFQPFQLRL
jgi:hypothetical protein